MSAPHNVDEEVGRVASDLHDRFCRSGCPQRDREVQRLAEDIQRLVEDRWPPVEDEEA